MCFYFFKDTGLKGFGDHLSTGMILIDLRKVFDTKDHEILLQKFEAIRFSESIIKWFKSYFSYRIFFVNTENKFLIFKKISRRVPQGPILRPLLFLMICRKH